MPSKKITYLKYKKFGNRVEWDGIKIVVSKISSHKKQYGVIATKKLLKGTRIPYFGKMRKESSLTGKENYCYFMHLRKNIILDGNPKYEPLKGKWITSRINEPPKGCRINCRQVRPLKKLTSHGHQRIFYETLTDIKPGKELFVSYEYTEEERQLPHLNYDVSSKCINK